MTATSENKSATDQSTADYGPGYEIPQGEIIAYAAKKSGLSPIHLGRDFFRLSASGRNIEWLDYVRHKMWDKDLYSEEDLSTFLGARLVWSLAPLLNSKSWEAVVEDKFMMSIIAQSAGLPLPETVAIIDRSSRFYPEQTKISDADALRGLLMEHAPEDLFLKTVGGAIGFGTMALKSRDEKGLTTSFGESYDYETFLTDIIAADNFLIQRRLRPHPDLAKFCSNVPTVRMPNFLRADSIVTPIAALRMPQGDNVADHLWRKGNIACAVSVETGEIESVTIKDGHFVEYLDDHPDVPGLKGSIVPCWDELKEINERTARLFSPIIFQGVDIALSDRGPVLLELNWAPGFDVVQNVTGRGLLTPDIKAFFADHDIDFQSKKKKKRFGLF